VPVEVRLLHYGLILGPTWHRFIRYLRATKWDAAKAIERLESTLKWRREFGLYTHTPEYLEPEVRVPLPRSPHMGCGLTITSSKVPYGETDSLRL